MRPIFSPTEYIQIKGRGTRLFTFKIGHTEYEKRNFFLLDFCGVAEYFEEKYDYTVPLPVPRERGERGAKGPTSGEREFGEPGRGYKGPEEPPETPPGPREIPTWEGHDTLVSREVIEVGPEGEKVDLMTFRGSFERDLKEFAAKDTRATELLFLKWFVDHLAKNGRAGVIVPNGVLFGSNRAATHLRETLLTECDLQAVVNMPSGVFRPYSGVGTPEAQNRASIRSFPG